GFRALTKSFAVATQLAEGLLPDAVRQCANNFIQVVLAFSFIALRSASAVSDQASPSSNGVTLGPRHRRANRSDSFRSGALPIQYIAWRNRSRAKRNSSVKP